MFGFNVEKVRQDFPILKKGIIYLDNACMSLKPKQVIDKMLEYYSLYTSCSGRSAHKFSKKLENEIELARREVQKTINAKYPEEIIFTRNTTESINLIVNSLGLHEGDEIVISDKEHNSNLIPCLRLKKKGVKVVISSSNQDNTFNLDNFQKCLTDKTKLVSIVHTSNLDGVTNPIKEISKLVHKKGILLLVDAAQSFPHLEIDARELDIDFLAFSGHKALAPTGIGVLYGKKILLEKLEQFIVGGHTVLDSTYESYKPEKLPEKFEAGLQNYSGILGLGEACRYLKNIGFKKIEEHIIKLNKIVTNELLNNKKIEILGPKEPEKRSGIFTFNIKGMSPHDVAKILDSSKNIMVRSGAFCVHSWFNNKKIDGAVRASFYLYNTEEEARLFGEEIKKISQLV